MAFPPRAAIGRSAAIRSFSLDQPNVEELDRVAVVLELDGAHGRQPSLWVGLGIRDLDAVTDISYLTPPGYVTEPFRLIIPRLVLMEDLLHAGPPFVGSAVFKRFVAGLAHVPPSLGRGICGHLRHVPCEVAARVLEVAEEVVPSGSFRR